MKTKKGRSGILSHLLVLENFKNGQSTNGILPNYIKVSSHKAIKFQNNFI